MALYSRRNLPLFLVVFLLALVVRTAWLDRFPPGLWFDEGLKGVDAWRTLHGGGFLLNYPDVFPREPLFIWILSVALGIFGPRVIVLRLTVALLGSLACALFFRTLVSVERRRGQPFALAAAFVLATMHWHAHFSRLVFRTNMVPLVAIALLWAMSAAAQTPRSSARGRWAWVGAGLAAGLGFYAYLSWWFFLPVVAVWFWALRGDASDGSAPGGEGASPRVTKNASPALFFLLGAAAMVLPLAVHYFRFPEHLLGRPEAISPFQNGFADGLRQIVRNARDVLLMFTFSGDHVPKHNVPWTPVLDPFWSVFFYAGIIRAGLDLAHRGARGRRAVAWLAWLFCMSLPSVFSKTDSANMLRNLGATPAVAYFVASGWWWGCAMVRGWGRRYARWGPVVLMAALLAGGGLQVCKSWVLHPRAKGIAQNFNVLHVEIARLCRRDPHGAIYFIPTDFYTHKTFEFLTIGRGDIRPLDPAALVSAAPAGTGPAVDHIVLCTMLSRNYWTLAERFPDSYRQGPGIFMGDTPFAWLLRIPATSLLPPTKAEREVNTLGLSTER